MFEEIFGCRKSAGSSDKPLSAYLIRLSDQTINTKKVKFSELSLIE